MAACRSSQLVLACAAALVSQTNDAGDVPADDPARLGGAGTVFDDGPDAFGAPVAVLSSSERRAFMVGNALFRANWIAAPASVEGMDGLGPLFNARSCSSCHGKDGRGRPPLAGADGEPGEKEGIGFLVRLRDPVYGGQLQEHAIDGVPPEGRVVIHEELVRGRYADGAGWELAFPRYEIVDPGYGPFADPTALSPRVAPQMIGLGLLAALPEATILAGADPDDRDGDGISGRPRWLPDAGGRRLGRFGWKAGQPTVRDQTAAAFANDLGITSSVVHRDDLTAPELEILAALERTAGAGVPAGAGDPELSDHRLDRIAFYSEALAVPAQRDAQRPDVVLGEGIFASIGCTGCHTAQLRTGDGGQIEGLRRQLARPFTDLLLHDLGERLADGLNEGDALPAEWRTPPLWGIGLFEVVSGHHRYLHDGRARTLEEAVLWHGGEAEAAASAFRALAAADRAALIAFLGSL